MKMEVFRYVEQLKIWCKFSILKVNLKKLKLIFFGFSLNIFF